jgi:hypothetical protein
MTNWRGLESPRHSLERCVTKRSHYRYGYQRSVFVTE